MPSLVLSCECLCVCESSQKKKIPSQLYQVSKVGVLNEESCGAWGGGPSGSFFIGGLETIVNVMAVGQASQWQTHNGALVTNLLVTKEVKDWLLQNRAI